MEKQPKLASRITIHPDIRGGRPCIRGMRISVYDILDWLASGMTQQDILRDYSELERGDIEAALRFVGERENKTQYLVS
ncbi:MAG TPA: DUF433 domain-containing protein [Cyclobacteriaceae bacterium]|nr:DUF433 domain-containing protein [Cyclobacteriaceae bacterium]